MRALHSKFTEKISVPIFTNDELVLFAKSYSAELGYKIDEMAILALHNRISNIERIDQATTLTEVKDIIDEAIDREAHSGLKKAISILTARRYTDDDRIVLKEIISGKNKYLWGVYICVILQQWIVTCLVRQHTMISTRRWVLT